jgi:hypothetical protein
MTDAIIGELVPNRFRVHAKAAASLRRLSAWKRKTGRASAGRAAAGGKSSPGAIGSVAKRSRR